MSTERPTQSDKELWRSLAADRVASGPVSDLDFAAWLEGRLSETAAARIGAVGGAGHAAACGAGASGSARQVTGRLRGRAAGGACRVVRLAFRHEPALC